MQVGINTAVYEAQVHNGATQLECLQTLATRSDIQAVEVRGEFFNAATKQDELTTIQQLCAAKQWALYYSVPEELFGPLGVNANLITHLKMAEQYHIKSLKYSFGTVPVLSAATLKELKALLAATPVHVTIENQPNQNGTLANFEQALDWVKTNQVPVGYTFDSGNWYWVAEQPEAAFERFQEMITVFHLKDIKDQTTVMLGAGATDWEKLLKALPAEMPMFIEYAIAPAALAGQIELVKQALD